MKRTTKTFIGGCVCGGLVCALIGGYVVAMVMGTAFIKYAQTHPIACQNVSVLTKTK